MRGNPKSRPAEQKKHFQSSSRTMRFFLAGCAAEIYVLLLQRNYYNADVRRILAWADALPVVGWITLGIALVSALAGLWLARTRKRQTHGAQRNESARGVSSRDGRGGRTRDAVEIGLWYLAAECVFLSAVSFLCRWNMSLVLLFSVLVPLGTFLGVLWLLYDRECALSLTVLCGAALCAWIRCRGTGYVTASRMLALFLAAALIVLILLLRRGILTRFLPGAASPVTYAACGISIAGVLAAAFNAVSAYYALWTLGLVIFGLVVYYTVKQL